MQQKLQMVEFGVAGMEEVRTLVRRWKKVVAELGREEESPAMVWKTHQQVGIEVEDRRPVEEVLETLNIRRQGIFWEPLCIAATLGMLGRLEEGRQAAADLLELKPEFPTRARMLIDYYIKFEDIVERVIKGLHKAGLHVA
jgi:hypothetical protein